PGDVGLKRRTGISGHPRPSDLRPLEELDRVARLQLHDRLLPAGLRAADHAAALRLRLHLEDVHALDLDAEELLDRLPHLGAVRVVVHAEGVDPRGRAGVALLGHDRLQHDLARVHYLALPSSTGSAASETSSERAQTTAPTSSSAGGTTATRSRFRNDFASTASSSVQTSTIGRGSSSTSAAARRVDGVSNAAGSTSASDPAWTWLLRADRNAALAAFRFTFCSKVRGVFANAWPPPSNCGARIVPWRARPVPFWRHGF